jgi:hypothetical protein
MKFAAIDTDEKNWQLLWFYNRLSTNWTSFNKRGNVHIKRIPQTETHAATTLQNL